MCYVEEVQDSQATQRNLVFWKAKKERKGGMAGSVHKSTGSSSRAPGFSSQHLMAAHNFL